MTESLSCDLEKSVSFYETIPRDFQNICGALSIDCQPDSRRRCTKTDAKLDMRDFEMDPQTTFVVPPGSRT